MIHENFQHHWQDDHSVATAKTLIVKTAPAIIATSDEVGKGGAYYW